jgi:hypothetical protein
MSQNEPARGLIIERILRDRDGIWRQVVMQQGLGRMTFSMFITSVVSLAAYGAVLGASNASNSLLQAASSAVKLPLLFLATLAICLPTLYLFNLIFGARLSMMQAVTLIMTCISVTAVLVVAFAPISLFFLITANNYEFFKLLNVAILVLAAIVGLRFLTQGMGALNHYQAWMTHERERLAAADATASAAAAHALAIAPPEQVLVDASGTTTGGATTGGATTGGATTGGTTTGGTTTSGATTGATATDTAVPVAGPIMAVQAQPSLAPVQLGQSAAEAKPASMTLLYIWIALFGFVGTQLAWTLRPFFGSPYEDFEVFRDIEGTFYSDIFRTIGHLFS